MVLLLQAQGVKSVLMTTAHTHWHTLTNSVPSKRDGTHIKEHSGSKEDVCQGQNHQPGQGWHQKAWKGSKVISIICPSINYRTIYTSKKFQAEREILLLHSAILGWMWAMLDSAPKKSATHIPLYLVDTLRCGLGRVAYRWCFWSNDAIRPGNPMWSRQQL